MNLGSKVVYQGRTYVLVGIDPMNVTNRRAYLHDVASADVIEVPLDQVEEEPKPPGLRPVS
jgi:hypothetical protein